MESQGTMMKLLPASLLLIHGNMSGWRGGSSQLPDIYEVLTEWRAYSCIPSFMSSCLGPTPLEKHYRSKEGAVPLKFACFKQLKCVSLLSQCYVLDITSD